MKAIDRLQYLGYAFKVEGSNIRYTYRKNDDPPSGVVAPLLRELREHKKQALDYLRKGGDMGRMTDEEFVRKARASLGESGAFVGHSPTHGDALFVEDEDVSVPAQYEDLPRWTMEEVRGLVEDEAPPDVVSHFMEIKRQFPEATYEGQEAQYSSREDHNGG